MPVEFTEESVSSIAHKAKLIMSLTNKPFILENITYYYSMPTDSMSELMFLNEILKKVDCGLLLDLNNFSHLELQK